MKQIKETAVQLLTGKIKSFFEVKQYKPILQFAVEDIDLSGDISSERNKVDLENAPHLVEPLAFCSIEKGKRKECSVAFPEQCGKTLLQEIVAVHAAVYNQLQGIIVLPSEELSAETALVKYVPLFRKVPMFAEELQSPFAIRSDRIKFSNVIFYFQGAGRKIVSKSAALTLADECAIWQTPNGINNILELKKRSRSYSSCLNMFVSTPNEQSDHFWKQWLTGSQGYYYLRCQNCGKLSMRSADIFNLQFETKYDEEQKQYVPIIGSERLVCPECKHEHKEEDRPALVKQGGYIHRFPERKELNASFQCGVLASLLPVHSFSTIASVQLACGKTAELEDFKNFDNSYRGLPYMGRETSKDSEIELKKHFYKKEALKPETFEAIYVVSDTQDTFSPYAVIALDKNSCYWVLQMGRKRYLWLEEEEKKIINSENQRNNKPPEETLLDLLDKQFFGMKPLMLFTDMRGHRSEQVKNFSKLRKNIILYGGSSLRYQKWKLSENINKLFLCDAKKFQSELVFLLYFQPKKETNFLWLPEDLSEKDLEEIACFQPDNTKKNGNLYENWIPGKNGQACHDFFDVLKMALAAVQISAKIFKKEKFRFGEARVLNPDGKIIKRKLPKASKPKSPPKLFLY